MVHQQKEDVALIFFRQAVFIAPDFLKAYHGLGNCLARLVDRKRQLHTMRRRCGSTRYTTIPQMTKLSAKGRIEDQFMHGYCLTCLVGGSLIFLGFLKVYRNNC